MLIILLLVIKTRPRTLAPYHPPLARRKKKHGKRQETNEEQTKPVPINAALRASLLSLASLARRDAAFTSGTIHVPLRSPTMNGSLRLVFKDPLQGSRRKMCSEGIDARGLGCEASPCDSLGVGYEAAA